jgi:CRISPR-associated endoribonuclease Cas6
MRIRVNFEPDDFFSIGVNYNDILQAFIYRHISEELAKFLHDEGYIHEKRAFKLFTFSRLLSARGVLRYNRRTKKIETASPFGFIISSPVERMIKEFASSMAREENLLLGKNRVHVSEIDVLKHPELGEQVKIRMLSLVTVYSTLKKPDGRKKTYYYHPAEPGFEELIKANLLKKLRSLHLSCAEHTEELSHSQFKIEMLADNYNPKVELARYKGFIIKGYMGRYVITADPLLIELAYHAGIGAKNSQGFGCFEII